MPKRRHFKTLQGSSSSGSKAAASKGGTRSDSPSVNERLSELRNARTPDSELKKRELAAVVNQRSVPPSLRGILGVPESAPPTARPGVRARERLRTPGPAPPRSWLRGVTSWTPTLTFRGGRRGLKNTPAKTIMRNKPRQALRFARLSGLRHDGFDEGVGSLVHLTLKTIAEQWELLDEEDYPSLIDIPLRLRISLLSYIASYGPAINIQAFHALTQGTDPIAQLDLGGLIGYDGLTLPRLTKALKSRDVKEAEACSADVADSWDQEDVTQGNLSGGPSFSRFSHLTHLCLSHPSATTLWRDLLALSKQTPQLTNLSLAYWPRPTLTPNLATTTVANQHGLDVSAGGSHFYSALDQDMSEPASLLKQLSSNLLRLQWLDLEGCSQWMPALASLSSTAGDLTPPAAESEDEWVDHRPAVMTIVADTWQNLTHIRCAQGWLPDARGVKALPRQGAASDARFIKDLLSKLEMPEGQLSNDGIDIAKRMALIWLETENRVLSAGRSINNIRRAHKRPLVTLDLGWTQKPV